MDGLINFILLILGATAVPALIGFIVLLVGRFRSPAAYPALILGLLTVVPTGICCGWIYWEEAWVGYGVAAGLPLLLGMAVCGLAWWSRQHAFGPKLSAAKGERFLHVTWPGGEGPPEKRAVVQGEVSSFASKGRHYMRRIAE